MRRVKSRASLALLLALAIVLPLSHLEISPSDDSWLLQVDGRPVDLAGRLAEHYTALTRNCRPVQAVPATDPQWSQALRAIAAYSPPDSLSAQLVQLIRQDTWWLAQARFSGLQDAVVLLTASGQELTIADGAVWSGSTHPHRPGPVIRRYLQARAPAAPAGLMACFEPVP